MPKKNEKIKSSITTPYIDTSITDEDDVYTPKGVFSEDFPKVCKREGVFEIPLKIRPKLPDSSSEMREDATNNFPTTFRLISKKQYLQPKIETEYEDDQDDSSLTAIYFKAYKLNTPLIEALSTCLPHCQSINKIHLWNVGLTPTTLQLLANKLPEINSLKEVILDGNPISEGNFSYFLSQETASFDSLTIRACSLNLKQCKEIGISLRQNKTLIHLDLSCNNFDDEEAIAILYGLRINRTLHSLSLACNSITDKTAQYMLNSLFCEFSLTHEEVVERRKLVFSMLEALPSIEETFSKFGVSSGPTPSPITDKTSSVKLAKTTPSKDNRLSGGKPSKKEEKAKSTSKPIESAKKRAPSKLSKRNLELPEVEKQEAFEYANPLIESNKVYMRNNQIYIAGNMTLINLNLAYNRLTSVGVESLFNMVQKQMLPRGEDPYKPGLLRIVVTNNNITCNDEIYTEFSALMDTRNPLLPSEPNVDAQTDEQDIIDNANL